MATSMTWEDAQIHMRQLRERNARKSEEVIELWDTVLADFSHKLGDDLWLVYEQVCIAACDCGHIRTAESCIKALECQFPDSARVKRLKGLQFEAAEKYDEATKIYKNILEKNETNSLIRKRFVAIYKAQNMIPEAIKELNDYLKKFMGDYEGWMELCDLYLLELDFNKASFCMEELLMSNPHNHLYHQRYAEIKYSQGGPENMDIARRYFSQALKLRPSNMRALFGLFLSANFLASSASRLTGKEKKDNIEYAAWAADQISQKYKEQSREGISSNVKALDGMLDSLAITQS